MSKFLFFYSLYHQNVGFWGGDIVERVYFFAIVVDSLIAAGTGAALASLIDRNTSLTVVDLSDNNLGGEQASSDGMISTSRGRPWGGGRHKALLVRLVPNIGVDKLGLSVLAGRREE